MAVFRSPYLGLTRVNGCRRRVLAMHLAWAKHVWRVRSEHAQILGLETYVTLVRLGMESGKVTRDGRVTRPLRNLDAR